MLRGFPLALPNGGDLMQYQIPNIRLVLPPSRWCKGIAQFVAQVGRNRANQSGIVRTLCRGQRSKNPKSCRAGNYTWPNLILPELFLLGCSVSGCQRYYIKLYIAVLKSAACLAVIVFWMLAKTSLVFTSCEKLCDAIFFIRFWKLFVRFVLLPGYLSW